MLFDTLIIGPSGIEINLSCVNSVSAWILIIGPSGIEINRGSFKTQTINNLIIGPSGIEITDSGHYYTFGTNL